MDDFGNDIKHTMLTGYGMGAAMLAYCRFIIDGGGNRGPELSDDDLRFYGLIA